MNYFEKIVSQTTGLTDIVSINEILNILSMDIDLGSLPINVLKNKIKVICK